MTPDSFDVTLTKAVALLCYKQFSNNLGDFFASHSAAIAARGIGLRSASYKFFDRFKQKASDQA